MTTYTLRSPLVIGSRLMPALIVAVGTAQQGTISAEIAGYDGDDLGAIAHIHYFVEASGFVYEATDVRGRVRYADDTPSALIREGMASILSFLGADAESYRATMGASAPRDGWLFSAEVAEWAYLNDDELAGLRDALEHDDE